MAASFLITLSLACSKSYSVLPVSAPAPPASTASFTPTSSPFFTPSPTSTSTKTPTSTVSATGTFTSTVTNAGTPTNTATNTTTSLPTNTGTSTTSSTPTPTPTISPTPSNTKTPTLIPTFTCTGTPTNTPTITDTPTITYTPTITDTFFPTYTYTFTPTSTVTNTITLTFTFTPTGTIPTFTPTSTYSPAPTPLCGSGATTFGVTLAGEYAAGPFAGQGIFWQTASLSQPATLTGLVFQSSGGGGNVRVAIYGGSGLVAQSSPMETVAGWNIFPMPNTYLAPGGYTLAFQVEGVANAPSGEAGLVATGTTLGYTGYYAYAPFPAALPTAAYTNSTEYIGFYALGCPAPVWTNTPTPNATLFTSTPTVTITPTAVIHWSQAATSVSAAGGRYGQSSAAFNGDMWVIAGDKSTGAAKDVLYSSDGANWNIATSSAAFPARLNHQTVVFNSLLWVLGGISSAVQSVATTYNDVWSSPDGVNWTSVNANAPFATRELFSSVAFNPYTGGNDGALWVIGGVGDSSGNSTYLGDVWYSQDGANWTEATANPAFGARYAHSSVVFNNKIWVIGGVRPGSGAFSDVWSSSDGVNWTEATANAPFTPRWEFTALAYNNLMWVIGGFTNSGAPLNDVWSSPDGVNWTEETPSAEFSARGLHSSVVFNNEMWAICGSTGSTSLNDTWHSP